MVGGAVETGRVWQRRLQRAALAAVATAALVAGILAVVSDDPDGSSPRVVPPATEATEPSTVVEDTGTPSTTLPPPAPLNGAPETIVAFHDVGIVLLDTATGRVIRQLAGWAPGVPPLQLVLGPDDRVYYNERTYLRVVGLHGEGPNPPTVLEETGPIAFSPDGRKLAYLPTNAGEPTVVVRTLATRTERRISDFDHADHYITDLTWADGHTLLFTANEPEGIGELWRLDLRSAERLTDARRLGPPNGLPAGTSWVSPRLRAYDGLVALVQNCCALDAGSYDGGASVLVIDPDTGAVRGRATFDFVPSEITYDSTGRHMLIISRTFVGESQTTKLYRRSGGAAVLVAENVEAADW